MDVDDTSWPVGTSLLNAEEILAPLGVAAVFVLMIGAVGGVLPETTVKVGAAARTGSGSAAADAGMGSAGTVSEAEMETLAGTAETGTDASSWAAGTAGVGIPVRAAETGTDASG